MGLHWVTPAAAVMGPVSLMCLAADAEQVSEPHISLASFHGDREVPRIKRRNVPKKKDILILCYLSHWAKKVTFSRPESIWEGILRVCRYMELFIGSYYSSNLQRTALQPSSTFHLQNTCISSQDDNTHRSRYQCPNP
jgi:hypothetical protein